MNKKYARVKIRSLLYLLVLFLAIPAAFSQTPITLPTPTGQVNDFAGVMDPAIKQQLEKRLRDFKAKTNPSVDIAVAVVDTTGDRPIFDYSITMAREWGIGSKEDDNPGVLLLVAVSDRKYQTQISRNLEDELPDGVAGQLQRQYLVPEFKQGNYSKGIADTIEAYIRTIEAKQNGTAPPVPAATPERSSGKSGGLSVCSVGICLIVLFVIMIIIFSRGGRGGRSGSDRDRWGGGGFGGGGGGDIAGNVLSGVAGAIIGNIISGGGSSSGGSSSSDWGGSSSGGGSDWGGFGGGGDFGGGGAGGDW